MQYSKRENGCINEAVAYTTASKDMEIQELKQALHLMQERLEKAEAAIASKNQRFMAQINVHF